MVRLRAANLALALSVVAGAVSAATWQGEARASVAVAVTWDGLLRGSTFAAIVSPAEAQTAWDGGRIYTYTRVNVERPVAGEPPDGGDVWVRTMGGVVDKIGQVVEGEPVLSPGQRSLVFLHPGPPGLFQVTARAQGQFTVAAAGPSGPEHLVRSGAMGALVEPHVLVSAPGTRLAADVLHGLAVDDAVVRIAADWSRAHGAH